MSKNQIMFSSRSEAGQLLAQKLKQAQIKADVVLGIPRGGVVVAEVIAENLQLPLKAIVVKKLGAPDNQELAIGAITYDNVTSLENDLIRNLRIDKSYINGELMQKQKELVERDLYLNQGKPLDLQNLAVILTDDGVATGATILAASKWIIKNKVKKLILALPVAARNTTSQLRKISDRCIVLAQPTSFRAVGQFYQDFRQITDAEVKQILDNFHLGIQNIE